MIDYVRYKHKLAFKILVFITIFLFTFMIIGSDNVKLCITSIAEAFVIELSLAGIMLILVAAVAILAFATSDLSKINIQFYSRGGFDPTAHIIPLGNYRIYQSRPIVWRLQKFKTFGKIMKIIALVA